MSKIMKPKRINELAAKFVIKTLPTTSGDPDYEYIKSIIQAFYANASTLNT